VGGVPELLGDDLPVDAGQPVVLVADLAEVGPVAEHLHDGGVLDPCAGLDVSLADALCS
jgi:hypothetical protein